MLPDVWAEVGRVDGPGVGVVVVVAVEEEEVVVQVAVQGAQEAVSVWAKSTTCENLNVEAALDRAWSL